MYGMTPVGVFFTAIFPLVINEQALCQQLHIVSKWSISSVLCLDCPPISELTQCSSWLRTLFLPEVLFAITATNTSLSGNGKKRITKLC